MDETKVYAVLPYPYSRYAVSLDGSILDLKTVQECPIKKGPNTPYESVTTWRDDNPDRSVTTHRHRLMALAFCENNTGLPFEKTQVNHIDGNKEHNVIENLEIVTQRDNIRHAYASGLQKHNMHVEVVCPDGSVLNFSSQKDACEFLNIKRSTMCEYLKGSRVSNPCPGYVIKKKDK